MRLCSAYLGGALLLTACGGSSTPNEAGSDVAIENQSMDLNTAAPPAEAAQMTRYACPDGSTVEARYPSTDTAQISYRDQTIDMRNVTSTSGARYVGGGWEWWTKGATEGTLSQLKPDEDIASAAGIICTAQ